MRARGFPNAVHGSWRLPFRSLWTDGVLSLGACGVVANLSLWSAGALPVPPWLIPSVGLLVAGPVLVARAFAGSPLAAGLSEVLVAGGLGAGLTLAFVDRHSTLSDPSDVWIGVGSAELVVVLVWRAAQNFRAVQALGSLRALLRRAAAASFAGDDAAAAPVSAEWLSRVELSPTEWRLVADLLGGAYAGGLEARVAAALDLISGSPVIRTNP